MGNRARGRGRWPLVWLLLLLVACAHDGGGPGALPPEEELPPTDDPAYTETVLKRHAEILRAIRGAEMSLENVRHLISVRERSEMSGSFQTFRDQSDFYRMQMEKERDLLKARGALARLERRVKQDHQGQLPPWWPEE